MEFQITLGQLQVITQGEMIGDPNTLISSISHPAKVTEATQMALILDEGILPLIQKMGLESKLHCALVPSDVDLPGIPNQLKVPRPKVTLARLLALVAPQPYVNEGIHPTAVIDETAELGESVCVGPYCVVGPKTVIGKGTRLIGHVTIGAGVQVGQDCLFYAGVRVTDRNKIGNRVILHINAAIGADGFSFVTAGESSMESFQKYREIRSTNDEIIKVDSVGIVVIGDDVEIGANSCVDKATFAETVIGNGTKIDNLVQIGHNAQLGSNCMLAGMAGVAGSAKIGNRCVIAGHSGVRDNTALGDDCILLPFSGTTKSFPDKSVIGGLPSVPFKEYMRDEMQLKRVTRTVPRKLDDALARIEQLEAKLAELTEKALERV